MDRFLDRFHTNKHGNLNGTCKDCENAAKRERYASNPESRRAMLDGQRKSKYGISREEFDDMLARQGGGCAICGTTKPGGKGEWHVDHDHSCCDIPPSGAGKTCGNCNRGLLCTNCNVGLGSFKDDVDRLAAAIKYLGVTYE